MNKGYKKPESPDLVLEEKELLFNDNKSGIIRVDKSIFDDFQKDSCIFVSFSDAYSETVFTYIMTNESDDYIEMQLLI